MNQHDPGLSVLKSAAFRMAVACLAVALAISGERLARGADAPAPPAAGLEIRGILTEPGLSLPIAGATALLFREPAAGAVLNGTVFSDKAAQAQTITDAAGAFRFTLSEAGTYRVRVRKNGYGEASPLTAASTSEATVRISGAQPIGEVRLLLARPGEIHGRIVDEESGEPMAGQDVVVYTVFFSRGQRRALPLGFATSRVDGGYSVQNLRAGDYVVGVRFRPWGPERIVKQFEVGDREVVDSGYRTGFWPGGLDLASALPVTIRSGDKIAAGEIRAKKTPFHRVHVSIPEGSCGSANVMQVGVAPAGTSQFDTLAQAPCGNGLLVRGLAPGAYTIEVVTLPERPEDQARGALTFALTRENLDIAVPLSRGIEMSGRVVAAEGSAPPPLEGLGLRLTSESSLQHLSEFAPVSPDAKGNFRLANVRVQEQTLEVSGLTAGFYVRQVRYNGRELQGTTIPTDPYAIAHRLEIVVDDRPSSVAGTVEDSSHPIANATVVLAGWPPVSPADLWSGPRAASNEQGRFQFSGLAPGEYRILAIDPAMRGRIEEPGVLQRLLESAKKLAVERGSVRSLTVELTKTQ